MRDTNRYGTAHSGRIEFGRQASIASLLAAIVYVALAALDLAVIAERSTVAGSVAGFVACFAALVGLALGIASRLCLRSRRHQPHRTFAAIGIALSLLFLLAAFVYLVLAGPANGS